MEILYENLFHEKFERVVCGKTQTVKSKLTKNTFVMPNLQLRLSCDYYSQVVTIYLFYRQADLTHWDSEE